MTRARVACRTLCRDRGNIDNKILWANRHAGGSNANSKAAARRRLQRAVSVTLIMSILLSGCGGTIYPTTADVDATSITVPPLNTIREGKGYLQSARGKLEKQRDGVLILDNSLSAGVVLGAATLALGTALGDWHKSSLTRAGVYTAATLGVQSALPLKTQALILNKGLDALNCVEGYAEAAYVPLRLYDALLDPVAEDIERIQFALSEAQRNSPDPDDLTAARSNVARAKLWLAIKSAPIMNVNAGVKIGVNSVMQTTIDQLASTLPDASAFARISYSFPGAQTPPNNSVPNQQMPAATGNRASVVSKTDGGKGQDTFKGPSPKLKKALDEVDGLDSQLHKDMNEADTEIRKLQTIDSAAPLPNINCTVASVVQPLQISAVSAVLTPASTTSTATVTITGGTAPYGHSISASTSGLTPDAISHIINGNILTLTSLANLKAGTYTLLISEAGGSQKTVPVIVAARPSVTKQTMAQTWQKGMDVPMFALAKDTFTDPQGLGLTYKISGPAWLQFDPAPASLAFSGKIPTDATSFDVTVTATNTAGLSETETFKVTIQ